MLEMCQTEQRPFGLPAHQRQQETALICRQSILKLSQHPLPCTQEGLDWHGPGGHAREIVLELLMDVPQRREQHLMDRPVMAREANDERMADARRNPFVCEKLHDVEQIARMLSIHRGDQLAAINLATLEK